MMSDIHAPEIFDKLEKENINFLRKPQTKDCH